MAYRKKRRGALRRRKNSRRRTRRNPKSKGVGRPQRIGYRM